MKLSKHKNKIIIFIFIILFSNISIYNQANGEVLKQSSDSYLKSNSAYSPLNGITTNVLKYSILTQDEISKITTNCGNNVDELKKEAGYIVFDAEKCGLDKNYEYVMIGIGTRNTTGYSIKMNSIQDNEGITAISISEVKPAEGTMQGQIITYPVIFIKYSKGTTNIHINTDTNERIYPYTEIKNLDEISESRWIQLKDNNNINPSKIWTVTFGSALDLGTIDNNSIYVRDKDGNIVKTELITNKEKKQVLIKASGSYKKGETYYLFVAAKSYTIKEEKYTDLFYKGYRMKFKIE